MDSISILGARGIGYTHARIFSELGVKISSVLVSSKNSVEEVSRTYSQYLGQNPLVFFDLCEMINMDTPDAFVVATPTHLHFSHLQQLAVGSKPILCEKPLIWNKQISHDDYTAMLDKVKELPALLCLNTANSFFIDCIKRLPPSESVQNFHFHFETKGKDTGRDVIADLFPHNLSLIGALLGFDKKPIVKEVTITPTTSFLSFFYGHTYCTSTLSTHSDKSFMSFKINEVTYKRIQTGQGKAYRVYLDSGNEQHTTIDPFKLFAKEFIRLDTNAPELARRQKIAFWFAECLAKVIWN